MADNNPILEFKLIPFTYYQQDFYLFIKCVQKNKCVTIVLSWSNTIHDQNGVLQNPSRVGLYRQVICDEIRDGLAAPSNKDGLRGSIQSQAVTSAPPLRVTSWAPLPQHHVEEATD